MERVYNIGNQFLFRPKKNTLSYIEGDDSDILLGSNECRLLDYFVEHSHRTIQRKELIEVLWIEREIFVDSSSLTQSVSTLRKALNDSTKSPAFIKTVPKSGYEFIASVITLSAVNPSEASESSNENSQTEKRGIKGIAQPQLLVVNSILLRFEFFILALFLLFAFKSTAAEILNIL
ncbi:winged helix-turn-helix domain-containing protein [Vibrio coralliilyticus]|uniref:winged helix-turn-helix domain-containing protein n=1 Tax=Vibrio coralliilyticus TaxID=190893 RepID=UPI0015603FFC|nr:winged helix-turn-helix domain-containing protein [Vibrio coralliilyticus]NRF31510.1 winged helix-turn-helix domain-containing protein [Vibrio coralliilyticus]NRF53560.1 winged helix-turn-helix domain-containing protein [Vibrio coralliilyticus]NRG02906.1 winged helix-turn-helix domain-containing protein [Vibrio coralliilyticus]